MQNSESTLVYQSNVFPVSKTNFREDRNFLEQIHDPFSLETMKKNGYGLSSRQEREYQYASVHCKYAYKNDYPWGTVTTDDNSTKVICKCTNVDCDFFRSCRPDFDINDSMFIKIINLLSLLSFLWWKVLRKSQHRKRRILELL